MNTRIHLARTGDFKDAAERAVKIDRALLAELAESYDANAFKAPLVLGHPADGAPAYGWVEKLVVDGDDLYGEVGEVASDLSDAVKAGRYRNVSISFWPKGAANSPTKDAATLRHVGILGAQSPVIKGLKPLALSEALNLGGDDGEVHVVEFSEDRFAWRVVRDTLRGFRDFFIDQFGQETADRVMPPYSIDYLTEHAVADDATAFSEPVPKEEEPAMSGAPETKTDAVKLAEAEDELAKLRADKAAREAADAASAAEARKAAAVEFADGLIAEAKLAPAAKDAVVEIHKRLAADGEALSFSDGATPTPLDAFTKLFDTARPLVELGEVAKPDQSTEIDAKDPRALTRRAQEIQKTDNAISFSEAIRKAEEEAGK